MADLMLNIPANSDTVKAAVEAVMPLAKNPGDRAKRNHVERIDKIQWIFRNERNAGTVGENDWAVYNAIGEYLDHHRDSAEKANEMALVTMDPDSWVSNTKVAAQDFVLSLA